MYLQFCVIKVDSFNFEDNIETKMKDLFKTDAVSNIVKLPSLTSFVSYTICKYKYLVCILSPG